MERPAMATYRSLKPPMSAWALLLMEYRSEISMVTGSRILLLPTHSQTQSQSAWEMAWAALVAQLMSPRALSLPGYRSEISMVTASRIWLLPTITQTQSRSAWETAW